MKSIGIKSISYFTIILIVSLIPAFSWGGCPEIDDDFSLAEGERTHPIVLQHSEIPNTLIEKMEAILDPDYQVDLNGIPFGSKVAALITLDVLVKK